MPQEKLLEEIYSLFFSYHVNFILLYIFLAPLFHLYSLIWHSIRLLFIGMEGKNSNICSVKGEEECSSFCEKEYIKGLCEKRDLYLLIFYIRSGGGKLAHKIWSLKIHKFCGLLIQSTCKIINLIFYMQVSHPMILQ